MTEEIRKMKDKVLEYMDQVIGERGLGRIDAKVLGEYADIIKDLAQAEEYCEEAQYYKTVTMAMGGNAGYGGGMGYGSGGGMGYNGGGGSSGGSGGSGGGGRSGYSGSPANGGNMMGHGGGDIASVVRDMLATASPEQRMQIQRELSMM